MKTYLIVACLCLFSISAFRARHLEEVVYDEARNILEQLDDFWKWDGTQWQRFEAENPPERRNSSHLIEGSGQLLLFGGYVPDEKTGKLVLSNELWGWKDGKWSKK